MSKKEIKIIALDLDGTLLNSKKQVSVRTHRVLEECEKRGIQVVPCTGRAKHAVPESILTLPGVRYGIFTNGASIYDLKEEKEIADSCIDWETARNTVELLRRYPVIYDMYIRGTGVCEAHFLNSLESYGLSDYHCWFVRQTRIAVTDLRQFLEETHDPVQKLNVTFREGDKETKQKLRAVLERLPNLLVTSSLPGNLELNAYGVTKGSGLERLSSILKVPMDAVMACGDGENDIPMIQRAGFGVCMGNGGAFVKEKADWVTLSNDEDGVAEAIECWAL